MADDFFGDLDQRISAMKRQVSDDAEWQQALREFRATAFAEMRNVGAEYAAKLRQRGISMAVGGRGDNVTIGLRWQDGTALAMSIAPERTTGLLQIRHLSTDLQTGRDRTSTVATDYDQTSWSCEVFGTELQELVRDYVESAPGHGGIA